MSDSIEQQVCQAVSDVMNVPLKDVTAATSPQTVEGWDSVQHLNLVLALEQMLGINFAPEEIEKMQSVGKITELVKAKR